MNDLEIIFTIIVGVILLLLPVVGYITELSQWNKGICEKTGGYWELFDIDSQGGRGYKSEEHTIWISYPFIDK
jgi:TM2 domain-containing membrane protein YozV